MLCLTQLLYIAYNAIDNDISCYKHNILGDLAAFKTGETIMSDQKGSQLIDDHSISQSNGFANKERNGQPASSQAEAILPPVSTGELNTWQPQYQAIKHTVKARSLAKRMLFRLGIPLAILLVLGLVGMAIYTSFAFQNITAFQVGTRRAVPLYIGGGGIVFARQEIPISYAAAGRITNVIVNVGDQVKAGQPLVSLDKSLVNVQITLASNNVSAAQAYLDSVANAFPYNPVAVANAQQRLRVAQNVYNSLLSETGNTWSNGNIVAPTAGIVSTITVTAGENFAARTVLLTLTDLSTITVHAEIPLENLAQVHNGMAAIVNPSALPDQSLQGTVTSIVPQANPQTDTFEAYVQINHPTQDLLPGMSAFVRIQGQTNAFVVPQLAVLNPDRESAVYEIRNDHAYITNVHVIGRSDNSIYIDQGLSPNDKIVLLPLNHIHEGQYVDIIHLEH
jgi:RND family efflux transporter MFP subunit